MCETKPQIDESVIAEGRMPEWKTHLDELAEY